MAVKYEANSTILNGAQETGWLVTSGLTGKIYRESLGFHFAAYPRLRLQKPAILEASTGPGSPIKSLLSLTKEPGHSGLARQRALDSNCCAPAKLNRKTDGSCPTCAHKG